MSKQLFLFDLIVNLQLISSDLEAHVSVSKMCSVQVSRLTWALWCRRVLYGSSWSWWATILSTWLNHPAEARSSSATVSANLTPPVESASSCSSSWILRCLLASFRTKSCAREEEEVTDVGKTILWTWYLWRTYTKHHWIKILESDVCTQSFEWIKACL